MGKPCQLLPQAQLLQGENKGNMQKRGGQMSRQEKGTCIQNPQNLQEAHLCLRHTADIWKRGTARGDHTYRAVLGRVVYDL